MDPLVARFTSLARKDLPLLEYAVEFVLTAFDDAVLNSLFWIGGNYHRHIDLPDTTGLNWCLESVYLRSRAQPDPEPSPPTPRDAELKPEPTIDGEPETATADEQSLHGATELRIAAEPELLMTSVQVRKPATTPAARERTVDSEIVERRVS